MAWWSADAVYYVLHAATACVGPVGAAALQPSFKTTLSCVNPIYLMHHSMHVVMCQLASLPASCCWLQCHPVGCCSSSVLLWLLFPLILCTLSSSSLPADQHTEPATPACPVHTVQAQGDCGLLRARLTGRHAVSLNSAMLSMCPLVQLFNNRSVSLHYVDCSSQRKPSVTDQWKGAGENAW